MRSFRCLPNWSAITIVRQHLRGITLDRQMELNGAAQADPPDRPWWRPPRVRVTLRALLVMVLLVGAGLGLHVHSARVQRDAVMAINRAGGSVSYGRELPSETFKDPGDWHRLGDPRPIVPWPRWLVESVGIDQLAAPTHVVLFEENPDAVLAHVARLGRLKELFCYSSISDAGMVHLRGLKELRLLWLAATRKRPAIAVQKAS